MIPVIWSSDAAAVVLKPAGLATQAPAPHDSLEKQIREQFASRSRYVAFPHRLDRPVSGLILVAFTKRAARLLGEQFEARRIKKTYVACVQGTVLEDSQQWSDYLRKVDNEARVEIIAPEIALSLSDAKLAELQMLVIMRNEDCTMVELCPITGRMHQLRVQLASRGHAIIGDSQYGSNRSCEGLPEGSIALQASKLEFNDPINGKRISVQAPPAPWRCIAD
jgi:23S rRNA-/tRNA-specific pseudouridylate synthase